MCSRNSVLSGRYSWHIGFYDNNSGFEQGTPQSFTMLPRLLQQADPPYASHALGEPPHRPAHPPTLSPSPCCRGYCSRPARRTPLTPPLPRGFRCHSFPMHG